MGANLPRAAHMPKKGEEAGRQKSARSSSPRSGRPTAPAALAPKGAAPAKAAPQTSAPVSKEATPVPQAAVKTVEPSPEADEPYVYPDGRTYPVDGVSLCCLKPNYFPRSWAIGMRSQEDTSLVEAQRGRCECAAERLYRACARTTVRLAASPIRRLHPAFSSAYGPASIEWHRAPNDAVNGRRSAVRCRHHAVA